MPRWIPLALLCCLPILSRADPTRPNVLIVLTDDQGYGDMSCTGNPVLKTPNMDRLHDESVRFTDFHVAPMCTPTRGQLMSGMDALHDKATSVTFGRALLRRGIPTMADAFAAAGYRTGLFGKWHLGDAYPYRPIERGFQESITFMGFGFTSSPEFDNDYFNGRVLHNGKPEHYDGYCNDYWFTRAMAWMKQRKAANEPFFCYLPTNIPHGPTWVDPKYADPFKGKKYNGVPLPAAFYGMLMDFDDNLGKLDAFLRDTGLRDDTIVIFMSDNGGTGGVKVYNAGMRGHKTEYYDGGHRVPCFVRWPNGHLRPPGDVTPPTQIQDLFPTLLDLCHVPAPAGATFDGISLAKVLTDANAQVPDRILVVQYGQDIKKDDAAVLWNQWRLVHGKELYDLKTDPAQQTDISAQHPDIVQKLKQHYDGWWAKVSPGLAEYEPLVIGSKQQNPVQLASADWQDVYCDNSPQVRTGQGTPRGGPWNVLVDQDGEYDIALRRWPRQVDVPMSAPLPEMKTTVGSYPAGVGFPIAKARLTIAGQDLTADVPPDAREVTFHVTLKANTRTQLHGSFQDKSGADVCGAYYAYVLRKE